MMRTMKCISVSLRSVDLVSNSWRQKAKKWNESGVTKFGTMLHFVWFVVVFSHKVQTLQAESIR